MEYNHEEIARMQAAGWPPVLIQAARHPGQYACGLADGSMIAFQSAAPAGPAWVKLAVAPPRPNAVIPRAGSLSRVAYPERGVHICLGALVWIVEAPWGA